MHVYCAGVVAGAVMTTYLLEKSRVVFQGPNERNYHALYMLQQGADSAERAALCLERSCADYAFLSSSSCYANPEWGDDAEEYRTMRTAMGSIGLAPQAWHTHTPHAHAHARAHAHVHVHMRMHVHGTWHGTHTAMHTPASHPNPSQAQSEAAAVLAAVLHMGNVAFGSDAAEEYAIVATEDVMARVSGLMGCDDVSGLVLQRTMKVPGAVYNIQLTPLQAQAARNAFGKAVYCLLFDWVVAKVNDSIRGGASDAMTFIGLLDVFGFEIFEVNSFEQLCINFANEKLHQFFLKFVFKMEEQIYTEECIRGIRIDYADNQPCIDLVEKPPLGIFRLLDSQCKTPKANRRSPAAAPAAKPEPEPEPELEPEPEPEPSGDSSQVLSHTPSPPGPPSPQATDVKFCAAVYESHGKSAHLVVPRRRPREDVEFTVRRLAA